MKELIAILALLFASLAHAQNVTVTGAVKASGRGCPTGNVSVTFSPDMGAFSILFDELKAEVIGAGQDSKNCLVEFPLHIDPGYRLKITQVDHRGFQSLSAGDRAQLIAIYQWIGGNICTGRTCVRPIPIQLERDYVGPLNGDFLETIGATSDWQASTCGGDMHLRIDTHVRLGSSGGGSMMTLDSIDGSLQPSSVYHLTAEPCGGPLPPPPPGPGPGPGPGPRPPRPPPRPLPPRPPRWR